MNLFKRLSSWLESRLEMWLQKIANQNQPIENDLLPFEDRPEDDPLMGWERDDSDPRPWL